MRFINGSEKKSARSRRFRSGRSPAVPARWARNWPGWYTAASLWLRRRPADGFSPPAQSGRWPPAQARIGPPARTVHQSSLAASVVDRRGHGW